MILARPGDITSGAPAYPDDMTTTPAADGSLTLYTTTWCGFCRSLKRALDADGIGYREIDIETDPQAAAFVRSVNNGNQTVPTVVFPDGSAATNPSLKQVKKGLG